MDSMPDEKCSIVLSEYWMDLSSLVHGLVNSFFAFFWNFLVMEAACAIAAKLCPAEVPMMVPKKIVPDAAGCWFDSLLFNLVSQTVPRYERI